MISLTAMTTIQKERQFLQDFAERKQLLQDTTGPEQFFENLEGRPFFFLKNFVGAKKRRGF